MTHNIFYSIAALATIVPSSLLAMRARQSKDAIFFGLLALAVIGPLIWVFIQMSGTWHSGLSTTLWVTVAASMSIFAVITMVTSNGWRLTPLMAPYMIGVGVLATIWQQAPQKQLAATAPYGWIELHIVISVVTYGLLTIAAVAALAAFLQDRALKAKQPTFLTHILPSITDCEFLLVRLLIICEVVLALGLATGMATQYGETGVILQLDHKTVLTITSFVIIAGLLVTYYRSGVRGRMVARLVLLVYLLVTLGYPGVKFVTDVLMA